MRFLLLSFLLFLSSCLPKPSVWEHQVSTYGLDFTPYAAQGFLFTPGTYEGDYESIGAITVEIRPSVGKAGHNNGSIKVFSSADSKSWFIEKLNADELVSEAFRASTELGADALTRYTFDEKRAMNGDIEVPIYTMSGFAIKRTN